MENFLNCGNGRLYNGKVRPKCNGGQGCVACWKRYALNMEGQNIKLKDFINGIPNSAQLELILQEKR